MHRHLSGLLRVHDCLEGTTPLSLSYLFIYLFVLTETITTVFDTSLLPPKHRFFLTPLPNTHDQTLPGRLLHSKFVSMSTTLPWTVPISSRSVSLPVTFRDSILDQTIKTPSFFVTSSRNALSSFLDPWSTNLKRPGKPLHNFAYLGKSLSTRINVFYVSLRFLR